MKTTVFHLVQDIPWDDMLKGIPVKYRKEIQSLYLKLRKKNPVPNTEGIVLKLDSNTLDMQPYKDDKPTDLSLPLHNQWLGFVVEYDENAIEKPGVLGSILIHIIYLQNTQTENLSEWSSQFEDLMD